jgi:hypothetical protein
MGCKARKQEHRLYKYHYPLYMTTSLLCCAQLSVLASEVGEQWIPSFPPGRHFMYSHTMAPSHFSSLWCKNQPIWSSNCPADEMQPSHQPSPLDMGVNYSEIGFRREREMRHSLSRRRIGEKTMTESH